MMAGCLIITVVVTGWWTLAAVLLALPLSQAHFPILAGTGDVLRRLSAKVAMPVFEDVVQSDSMLGLVGATAELALEQRLIVHPVVTHHITTLFSRRHCNRSII